MLELILLAVLFYQFGSMEGRWVTVTIIFLIVEAALVAFSVVVRGVPLEFLNWKAVAFMVAWKLAAGSVLYWLGYRVNTRKRRIKP